MSFDLLCNSDECQLGPSSEAEFYGCEALIGRLSVTLPPGPRLAKTRGTSKL
jgi:hypothetical protein